MGTKKKIPKGAVKKSKTPQSKALAVVRAKLPVVSVSRVVTEREQCIDALTALAQVFSGKVEVAPKVVGEAYFALYTLEKAAGDVLAAAKRYVTDIVKATGTQTTEKGSMEAQVGGFRFEVRPTRTGTDPKKLEALLRAKGLAPAKYMEAKVTFGISESGIDEALRDGLLTTAELETVKYEPSFSLQPPQVALGDEG